MAVTAEARGRGLGRRLAAEAASRARTHGATSLWANARDSALGFYTRLGWSVVGLGFMTSFGVAHHLVVLPLGPLSLPRTRPD